MRAAAASTPATCAARPTIGGPGPTHEELSSLLDLFQVPAGRKRVATNECVLREAPCLPICTMGNAAPHGAPDLLNRARRARRPRPPQHYVKTLCVTIPRDAAVIQASHHGIQALAGLVAQLQGAGQSLQVWEHGVLMRERLIYREQGQRGGVSQAGAACCLQHAAPAEGASPKQPNEAHALSPSLLLLPRGTPSSQSTASSATCCPTSSTSSSRGCTALRARWARRVMQQLPAMGPRCVVCRRLNAARVPTQARHSPSPLPPPPHTRQLLYRRSDMVVPCNATFNTSWELWLGTDPNRLMPLLNALEIEHYPLLQVRGVAGEEVSEASPVPRPGFTAGLLLLCSTERRHNPLPSLVLNPLPPGR
jgi:hypothetical protein